MGKKEFEASIASGGHHRLARMIGEWEGTFRLWFQPDHVACEAPQRGTIRGILDGRFLLHEYRSRFGDDPIEGVAIYGLHLDDNAFESAWVESFGTGTSIMFSASPAPPGHFNEVGSYGDGKGGPRWDWRTEIQQPDPDQLIITMTNISPQGEAARAVEVQYRWAGDAGM